MRTISVSEITDNIREMCIEANHFLTPDMKEALTDARQGETSMLGCRILEQLQENLKIAAE
ncbi:MAG: fumarate hydratase, partial [Lachnospiraceae bacterium]|nr:fumarate hydratase [Lachnospiraceae bacterium]